MLNIFIYIIVVVDRNIKTASDEEEYQNYFTIYTFCCILYRWILKFLYTLIIYLPVYRCLVEIKS